FAPSPAVTLRGVIATSIGGVSFDESIRLEPVQLAGFNQTFRTIIPESLVGSVETPAFRNRGLSIDGRTPTRTYWSASWSRLDEDVARATGAFDAFEAPIFPLGFVVIPASTTETLRYREDIITATVNQLIGDEFSVGASYRRTRSRLRVVSDQ